MTRGELMPRHVAESRAIALSIELRRLERVRSAVADRDAPRTLLAVEQRIGARRAELLGVELALELHRAHDALELADYDETLVGLGDFDGGVEAA